MMCQQCGQRPANVHLTKIINGQKSDLRLCEECARERGEFEFWLEPTFNIHNLMAGFLGQTAGSSAPSPTVAGRQCPQCGLTYQEFAKTGLLGCAACYDTFSDVIAPIIRRVHGNTRHVGKSIRSSGKVDLRKTAAELEAELRRAVAEERYEDAARLRDELKQIQRQLAGERGS